MRRAGKEERDTLILGLWLRESAGTNSVYVLMSPFHFILVYYIYFMYFLLFIDNAMMITNNTLLKWENHLPIDGIKR